MVLRELTFLTVLLIVSCVHTNARSFDGIRSDVIETKYVPDPSETKNIQGQDSFDVNDDIANAKKPGWMVRTYRKFTNVFKRPKHIETPETEISSDEIDQNANQKVRQIFFSTIKL